MNISRFFVDRPIFAAVLSLLIFLAGAIAIPLMPISEYPDVVPPTVEVTAQYPGANPKVIAETVAAPLEEQINGVEGMLYMFSQGTSDGLMRLTVTFKIGTDPDKAQQLVENRVSQALPRLPDEVRQFGVTTIKNSPDLTMVVHTFGPGAVMIDTAIGFTTIGWILLAIGLLKAAKFAVSRPVAGAPQGFDLFNRFFKRNSQRYGRSVQSSLRRKGAMVGMYMLLILAAVMLFHVTPKGFIPGQDKQYLVSFAQLPDGANLDRTEVVMRKMSDIMLKHPAVEGAVAFPGLSIKGFTNSPSAGITFVKLKPFEDRATPDLSAGATSSALMGQFFMQIQEAFPVLALPPPPVMGLSTTGGAKLYIEDRMDQGYEALEAVKNQVIGKASQSPVFDKQGGVYSLYGINVPQLEVDIDRVRAKQLGLSITDIFATMQVYLGSVYINDFNRFGRTYRVFAQADSEFRARAKDISQLKTRSISGEMIPLGAVVTIKESYGPDNATRYNAYRAADINVSPAPGYSSGQVKDEIERIVKETLPKGFAYEWTELTYQEILAGNAALLIFPLCIVLVFMVLAAQYESLVLPLAVILIVPTCLFSALFGVYISGGENNIFTQIGLIVLVGLACKNAILIVEFARELEILKKFTPAQAAIESARLRLRPILMTSFAFIMGVLPLVFSSGAGAEMRQAMGVAVFSGMLGVTFFGLFLTPLFYVGLRMLFGGKLHSAAVEAAHAQHEGHKHD